MNREGENPPPDTEGAEISNYDDWRLASPPEADEEDLTDVACTKCDWEGNVVCYIMGNELTWECPGCEYEHSEDPADRFSQDPDDRY